MQHQTGYLIIPEVCADDPLDMLAQRSQWTDRAFFNTLDEAVEFRDKCKAKMRFYVIYKIEMELIK